MKDIASQNTGSEDKPINQSALISTTKQAGKSIGPVSLASTVLNMLFATCPFRYFTHSILVVFLMHLKKVA